MILFSGYTTQFRTAILVLLMHTASFSQLQQPHRFEKERKFSDRDFTILPLKEDGMALIREQNKYKSGNQTWEIILLDTALQERGVLEPEIDNQSKFIGYEYSPGFVHILFNKNEFKSEFEILSVNLISREIFKYEINPELKFQITHFIKAGENFIFGGYVNLEPAVLLYTSQAKNIKILPGFFQKDTELLDLRANQNQTFNTLLIDRGDRRDRKIILKTFDSIGKLLLEEQTDIEEEITLLNGISSTLEREDLGIIGTWGKRTSKQASGFYFFPVNPYREIKINRIYLAQLMHYLDYLKPKKAAKIKMKTQQALETGKTFDFVNYITPIKITEYSGGFLLLAESYSSPRINADNPYSGSTPYYSFPYYGVLPTSSIYNTPNVAGNNSAETDEITKIESVVIAFNGNGTVLWDHSTKFDNVKRPIFEQVSDFHLNEENDRVYFLYKKDSDLKLKIINLSDNESVELSEKTKLNDPQDELRSEDSQEGFIKHWFDGNFYVWGYQSIRNKTGSGEKTREVFYVNKVVVH